MSRSSLYLGWLLEHTVPWLVLGAVVLYSIALFFGIPYQGFDWVNDRVLTVFVPGPLKPGDRLIEIDGVSVKELPINHRLRVFHQTQPGHSVPIRIERGGQTLTVDWTMPEATWPEFWRRLIRPWWLAWVFWFFGLLTLYFIRPKDERWYLLLLFNFITALWLSAGSVAAWHVWESAVVFHVVIWLCVPIYWHLHWVYPAPLGRLPKWLGLGLYLASFGLATLDNLGVLPVPAYGLALMSALAGSLILLAVHGLRQPDQRRNVSLLLTGAVIAFLPPLALTIAILMRALAPTLLIATAALPILPAAYFYAAYRGQFGGLHIRSNRVISFWLFFFLLVVALVIALAALETTPRFEGKLIITGLAAAVIGVMVTRYGLQTFQRQVEARLLGVPGVPERILETHVSLVTSSLDRRNVVDVLWNDLLPGLLVRQSALLRVEADRLTCLYRIGVEPEDLPKLPELPELLGYAGQWRPAWLTHARVCHWARLVLPLRLSGKTIGVWLLGQRDPDDFYAPPEIETLQAVAQQTAIALANIEQAEHLRALYKTNIERQERERANLAWELHDEVLNELGALGMRLDEVAPESLDFLQAINMRLRRVITGLRPMSLNLGLRPALEGLSEDLRQRGRNPLAVELEVEGDARYSDLVEQHIFRVVQQAGENAVRHGRARKLRIAGQLGADNVELYVEDDGSGLGKGDVHSLKELVEQGHFGMVGMFERVELIGAELTINSGPGRGTRVSIKWKRDGQPFDPPAGRVLTEGSLPLGPPDPAP